MYANCCTKLKEGKKDIGLRQSSYIQDVGWHTMTSDCKTSEQGKGMFGISKLSQIVLICEAMFWLSIGIILEQVECERWGLSLFHIACIEFIWISATLNRLTKCKSQHSAS